MNLANIDNDEINVSLKIDLNDKTIPAKYRLVKSWIDEANKLLEGLNGNNGTSNTNSPNDAQQKNNQTFFGNTPDLPLPPSSSPYPGGSDYNPGL